jgi:hypothetical protein
MDPALLFGSCGCFMQADLDSVGWSVWSSPPSEGKGRAEARVLTMLGCLMLHGLMLDYSVVNHTRRNTFGLQQPILLSLLNVFFSCLLYTA